MSDIESILLQHKLEQAEFRQNYLMRRLVDREGYIAFLQYALGVNILVLALDSFDDSEPFFGWFYVVLTGMFFVAFYFQLRKWWHSRRNLGDYPGFVSRPTWRWKKKK